jgi:hypothetical protein
LEIERFFGENEIHSLRDISKSLKSTFGGKGPLTSKAMQYMKFQEFLMVSPVSKPLLRQQNIKNCLTLATKNHKKDDNFMKTFFCQIKHQLQHSLKKMFKKHVHCSSLESGRAPQPSLQSGGFSILYWGCFEAAGPISHFLVDGKITALRYIEILKNNLLPNLHDRLYTFMQDNALVHTAKCVSSCLGRKKI